MENIDDQLQTLDQENTEQEEDYGEMDRKEVPYLEKSLGGKSFAKGDHLNAIKHYSKAILAYQFLAKDGQLSDTTLMDKYVQEIYLPCNLNLSLCYIKNKQYDLGRDFANKALQVEPENVKALYRRGVSYTHLQEFSNAKQDLKKVLALDPKNEDAKFYLEKNLKFQEAFKQKQQTLSKRFIEGLDYNNTAQEQKPIKQTWFQNIKSILCCQRKTKKQ